MTIELKATGLDEAIRRAQATPLQIDRALKRIVKWSTNLLFKEVKSQLRGKSVRVRSSNLVNSINQEIMDGGLSGAVGSSNVYSRMREYGTRGLAGGVLRPKQARFIAIPLPAALTPSGVPRGKPRDFKDAVFVVSKLGGLLLVGKPVESRSAIKPLFAMVPSVKQKEQAPFFKAEQIARTKIGWYTKREMEKLMKAGATNAN